MNRREEIIEMDNLVFMEFKTYFEKIDRSKFALKNPKTSLLTSLFTTSTDFIKNSIFDSIESDNLFSMKILFRSQIEYYLRFQLIWFNWCKLKDDSFSERYVKFSEAKEIIDITKAEVNADRLFDNLDVEVQWKMLFDKYQDLTGLSKSEIEKETRSFTVKNIIRYISEKLGSKYQNPMLPSMIVEYAKLSSYIHGGIAAHYESLYYVDAENRKKEYIRIAELSFLIAISVKQLTLVLLIQLDKEEFTKHYLVIDNVLKSFGDRGN